MEQVPSTFRAFPFDTSEVKRVTMDRSIWEKILKIISVSFFKESFSTGSPFLLKILTIFQGGGKRGKARARARSGFRKHGYGKVMTGRSQLSKGPRGPYAAPLLNGELNVVNDAFCVF